MPLSGLSVPHGYPTCPDLLGGEYPAGELSGTDYSASSIASRCVPVDDELEERRPRVGRSDSCSAQMVAVEWASNPLIEIVGLRAGDQATQ